MTGHKNPDLASANILVTGGFGYLGSHICDYFIKKGHNIKILSRSPHPEMSSWSNQFEVHLGNISEYSSIENCCRDIDIVIHAAAMNEIECREKHKEALLVNGLGTRNILEDAYRNNVLRFIYLSTFHVYGQPKTETITEEILPDPLNTYSLTHYVAELYCRQFEAEGKIKSHVLRISNGYGAPLFKSINRWTLVLNDLCLMAHQKGRIVLKSKGTQERDFVGTKDILRAIEIFLEQDIEDIKGNIYNLGSGQNISILDLANRVAEVYQELYAKSIDVEIPENASEPDIQLSFRFSIDKIKSHGYQPISNMKNEIKNIFTLLES